LGQRVSGLQSNDRVSQAAFQALPAPVDISSIYDVLPPAPVQPSLETKIADAQSSLQARLQNGLENAKNAETADEILASADELSDSTAIEQVIENVISPPPGSSSFPNLAREIMKVGMGMEGFHTKRLAEYKKEGDKFKDKIDLLVKLSSHLPKLTSDDTSFELKEEARVEISKIHEQLKARGIDLFPGMTIEKELSKEQLAAANSLINHHIDVSRTSLQELFTTKISIAIQFLSMIGEVMKKISDKDDQLKRKTTQLQR
jgi:hypothetical protein